MFTDVIIVTRREPDVKLLVLRHAIIPTCTERKQGTRGAARVTEYTKSVIPGFHLGGRDEQGGHLPPPLRLDNSHHSYIYTL